MSKIALGGGCFWCIETMMKELKGVIKVQSGYCGGKTKNPTYKEVCSGMSGHIEVVQVTYEENIISNYELLKSFLFMHDPTTLDRQGNDVGIQYRSVIFYQNDIQKEAALKVIEDLNKTVYNNGIVTKVLPMKEFYLAENDHQNFFENNPNQSYSKFVIAPKLNKFRNQNSDLLK
jgi:peptide-methionine (S)-S-oxide reductase